MPLLSWLVVIAYLVYVIWDGIRLSKHTGNVEGYFLANRSLPWWAVGLSVMATQLSAITLVGATGQAYDDGLRFVQFYYALPIAMVILCVTAVPLFYRAKVFTAYEFLENRFDVKTRTLTSFFFLISRGLGVGVVIAAPSVILSIILGWSEIITIFTIGMLTTFYTMVGGVQAVTWTDVKQMVIVFFGLGVCMVIIAMNFPEGVGMSDGFHLAGALDKLETFDTRFDLTEKYTVWSGIVAALFLFLAYFGTDQVQVQRYLTARSVGEGRTSILMSAFLKIPMQFGILIIGIMVFVFYQFQTPPMIFNEVEAKKAANKAPEDYGKIQEKYLAAHGLRETAAVNYVAAKKSGDEASLASAKVAYVSAHEDFNATRKEATEFVKTVNNNKNFRDVNYVFPMFVISNMPPLVIGLIIAAIFAASMSTISSELNALATATTIDFYRRNFNPNATDREYIRVGRFSTFVWGLFACIVALYSTNLGSLIEVVNKFGSFFYGSLLGVFVLAFGIKRARARGAFFGLLFGIAFVFITSTLKAAEAGYFLELPIIDSSFAWSKSCVQGFGTIACPVESKAAIEFLWLNLVGCTATVIFGLLISLTVKKEKK